MDEPGSCVVTVTFDLGYSTQPELANSVSAESADAESALFFCVLSYLDREIRNPPLCTCNGTIRSCRYFRLSAHRGGLARGGSQGKNVPGTF